MNDSFSQTLMKFASEVSQEKLRGAYYTPPPIVSFCLDRIAELRGVGEHTTFLEPAAGDGNFVEGISRFVAAGGFRSVEITCIEVDPNEASKCAQRLSQFHVKGTLSCESFFEWAENNKREFDAVVGNPPYVRYQFVPEHDRFLAEWLLRSQGCELNGVSNFWIPFVLLSLRYLKIGGAFALVLPSELFATVSGGQVRKELIRNFSSLQIDLFPRNSFPDILQDILVVSGIRNETQQQTKNVCFKEYINGTLETWSHTIPVSDESWTKYLLTSEQWTAFDSITSIASFHTLGKVAAISVSIVTGANDFFTIEDSIAEKYNLCAWVRPLLARTNDSAGLTYSEEDFKFSRTQGKKVWLLDFGIDQPDPTQHISSAEYLRIGEENNLPLRYKCRIRTPWYRIPYIRKGALMMAKRAHQHHRLLLNGSDVFTTDTIYRGEMSGSFKGQEKDLVAGFHNSVTLLSAELEGRTYGGGVLELVPSEIARLSVPMTDFARYLPELDMISRDVGGQRDKGDSLVYATDQRLCETLPALKDALPLIIQSRRKLRERRFGISWSDKETGAMEPTLVE